VGNYIIKIAQKSYVFHSAMGLAKSQCRNFHFEKFPSERRYQRYMPLMHARSTESPDEKIHVVNLRNCTGITSGKSWLVDFPWLAFKFQIVMVFSFGVTLFVIRRFFFTKIWLIFLEINHCLWINDAKL